MFIQNYLFSKNGKKGAKYTLFSQAKQNKTFQKSCPILCIKKHDIRKCGAKWTLRKDYE